MKVSLTYAVGVHVLECESFPPFSLVPSLLLPSFPPSFLSSLLPSPPPLFFSLLPSSLLPPPSFPKEEDDRITNVIKSLVRENIEVLSTSKSSKDGKDIAWALFRTAENGCAKMCNSLVLLFCAFRTVGGQCLITSSSSLLSSLFPPQSNWSVMLQMPCSQWPNSLGRLTQM